VLNLYKFLINCVCFFTKKRKEKSLLNCKIFSAKFHWLISQKQSRPKTKHQKEREMAARNLEKLASIDAQLRLLAPGKVSEDDKLVEYDALLLDRFLDILQDLHGEDIKETVMGYNTCVFFFFSLSVAAFIFISTEAFILLLICYYACNVSFMMISSIS
jgi:hypothetical protein